jgi:hypothetical protein
VIVDAAVQCDCFALPADYASQRAFCVTFLPMIGTGKVVKAGNGGQQCCYLFSRGSRNELYVHHLL